MGVMIDFRIFLSTHRVKILIGSFVLGILLILAVYVTESIDTLLGGLLINLAATALQRASP